MKRVTLLLAAILLLAIATQAMAGLSGAVWTTTANGLKVDANIYDQKCPGANPCVTPPLVPFLNGGPNLMAPGAWVPDGLYCFQVTDPPGKNLLSTDNIAARIFEIATVADKKILLYSGPHVQCVDAVTGGDTVALCPFLDTPNPGGEYKVWITRIENYNPSDSRAKFGFIPSLSKTDNFKVRKLASVWGEKVDQNGDPVPGLHIILYQVTKIRGVETLVRIADTVTNAEGEFSFSNLGAGKYAVNEDLPGTDNPSEGLDPIDYSTWTRVSPSGPIYFTIGKSGRSGPGAPIYIGRFVNQPPQPAEAKICGKKLLAGTDLGLEGWTITLEMKTGNGTWVSATDKDGTPVDPVVTDENGGWCFEHLKVNMTYRVSETLEDGWKQTCPNMTGDEEIVQECDDFTIIAVGGRYIINIGYVNGSGEVVEVTGLDFCNALAKLCVKKINDFGFPIAGWTFRLFEADGVTPATDGFGNAVDDVTTGEDGIACWDLLLGDRYYVVKEIMRPGWRAVGSLTATVWVEAGQDDCDPDVTFTNHAVCIGHTPGYWRNWDVGQPGINHPSPSQFAMLLQGTIANGSISVANAILDKWDNSPGDEVGHMAAFLLACQLTINLTQHSELPYSTTSSLTVDSMIPGNPHPLGYWIEIALDIWNADGVGYTREYITYIAGVLDAFCNANYP